MSSSSEQTESDCEPNGTKTPMANQEASGLMDVLSNTIENILELTNQLTKQINEISPLTKKYADLALELDQTRLSLPLRTLNRFKSSENRLDYFDEEIKKIIAAIKRFTLSKPKLDTMKRLNKKIKKFVKMQITAINLKKEWDGEKGKISFEMIDCIKLAIEFRKRLEEAKVAEEGASSSNQSDKDIPQSMKNCPERVEKFKKMLDCRSIQDSLLVFKNTIVYTELVLIMELGKELSKINCKIERFAELQLEVQQSRFAPLLPRIATRFAFVEEKEDYFYCKLEKFDYECFELNEWTQSEEFNTIMEQDDQKTMWTKSIEKNRLACQLMVTVRRLKNEWETVKENVIYEATECIRLVEELYNRVKHESNMNQEKK